MTTPTLKTAVLNPNALAKEQAVAGTNARRDAEMTGAAVGGLGGGTLGSVLGGRAARALGHAPGAGHILGALGGGALGAGLTSSSMGGAAEAQARQDAELAHLRQQDQLLMAAMNQGGAPVPPNGAANVAASPAEADRRDAQNGVLRPVSDPTYSGRIDD